MAARNRGHICQGADPQSRGVKEERNRLLGGKVLYFYGSVFLLLLGYPERMRPHCAMTHRRAPNRGIFSLTFSLLPPRPIRRPQPHYNRAFLPYEQFEENKGNVK